MTHKLSVGYVFVVLAVALLGAGCGKGVNFSQNLAAPLASSNVGQVDSTPSCEIDMSQYKLVANVNSFEFQDSFGISFGYNSQGVHAGVGGSANISVSTAKMDLSAQALNPLNNSVLISDEVGSDQTSTGINASVDFAQFSVNPNFYNSTPLSQVSKKGLDLGIQGIKKVADGQPWVGHILKVLSGAFVMVNAGVVSGLQVGDQFDVYNVTHIWNDDNHPCEAGNIYFGSQHTPSMPVATITITQVDPSSNISFASVVMSNADVPIRSGAEVLVHQLVNNSKSTRYLKKKVLVGGVAAKSFAVPGGGNFDFGSAVNGQMIQSVMNNGFVVGN